MMHWILTFTWCILHLVAQSSSILIDKSIVDKWSKHDQQLFKSFTNKTTDLNGDEHVNVLLENNRNWVRAMTEEVPDFFEKLGKGQAPKFLYFGCSDSRVPDTDVLGLGPGEIFVHRNVGNLVPGNDLNALSVLEYAVAHLGVTDILVTGHYDCGAVRASTRRQDLGLLENWLRLIRDVYRTHKEHLDQIEDEEARHFQLVELNVIEQCLNLFKTAVVQRKRMDVKEKLILELYEGVENAADSGQILSQLLSMMHLARLEEEVYPRIHGLVFNPKDGSVKKLPINFTKRVGSMDHIYGLYSR